MNGFARGDREGIQSPTGAFFKIVGVAGPPKRVGGASDITTEEKRKICALFFPEWKLHGYTIGTLGHAHRSVNVCHGLSNEFVVLLPDRIGARRRVMPRDQQ